MAMRFCLITVMLAATLGFSFETHGARNIDNSPLVVLPSTEWTGADPRSPKVQEYFNSVLSSRERQEYFHDVLNSPKALAYFHGVLETFGYFLLMDLARTPEIEQQFSDFRQCAQNNKNRGWPITGWLKGNSPNASAALGLVRFEVGLACEAYKGNGKGGWQPPELVSKQEWQGYSAIERKFYVSAYVETALEATLMLQENNILPRDGRVNSLVQCLTEKGVEKILDQLEETEVQTQYPMPWTVAKAVESVCDG